MGELHKEPDPNQMQRSLGTAAGKEVATVRARDKSGTLSEVEGLCSHCRTSSRQHNTSRRCKHIYNITVITGCTTKCTGKPR